MNKKYDDGDDDEDGEEIEEEEEGDRMTDEASGSILHEAAKTNTSNFRSYDKPPRHPKFSLWQGRRKGELFVKKNSFFMLLSLVFCLFAFTYVVNSLFQNRVYAILGEIGGGIGASRFHVATSCIGDEDHLFVKRFVASIQRVYPNRPVRIYYGSKCRYYAEQQQQWQQWSNVAEVVDIEKFVKVELQKILDQGQISGLARLKEKELKILNRFEERFSSEKVSSYWPLIVKHALDQQDVDSVLYLHPAYILQQRLKIVDSEVATYGHALIMENLDTVQCKQRPRRLTRKIGNKESEQAR